MGVSAAQFIKDQSGQAESGYKTEGCANFKFALPLSIKLMSQESRPDPTAAYEYSSSTANEVHICAGGIDYYRHAYVRSSLLFRAIVSHMTVHGDPKAKEIADVLQKGLRISPKSP
ncbi:hypothetical protein V8E36_001056 [Tilletia maclaganii]